MEIPKNSYQLSAELPEDIQNHLNPALGGTGFRVALRLPGMTTSARFESFERGSVFRKKILP
jgi:hypothetical protein